jgi:lipid A 3-O-deacylase
MKTIVRFVFFCCLACTPLVAQVSAAGPVDALRQPGWNLGVFAGGGTSVDSSPSGQNFLLGARIGRVLTHELGQNALRGSFEMAVDVIPLDEYWIHGGQYAGAINPFIVKWNFTGPRTVAPYAAIVGGVLFSSHNLPPGDTSQVNFTSGMEIGAQIFGQGKNSWNLAVKAYHLSNASLGNKNPGINSSLQFMLGYTWH